MRGQADALPDYPFRGPTAVEPPPEWARLRDECPVATVRLPSGDEAPLLTRYEDVRELLLDRRFTRYITDPDAARVTSSDEGVFERPNVIPMRGEAHMRWRRLVGRWFTIGRMKAMKPRIAEMAGLLIEEMVERGSPADLVPSLNHPLPLWVLCEILGVPSEDRDKFAHWSSTSFSLTKYTGEEIQTAQKEYAEYFIAHIAAKRAGPGDDLLSELITVVDAEDGRLSEMELLATGQGLLTTGHETTSNQLGKMISQLLAKPERWERLVADRSLVYKAVEETLRLDADGGAGVPRFLTEPVEIAGTTIPAGTTVMVSLAAANRDERVFADAGTMRLDRSPNSHLAFGAGPHSCLGQTLARTELVTALEVLLERLPTLALAVPVEELRLRDGLVVGGLESLPVTW